MQDNYPYIRAWGKILGSRPGYIEDQVTYATLRGAPADATFLRSNGTWATTREITRVTTRQYLGLPPLPPEPEQPYQLPYI